MGRNKSEEGRNRETSFSALILLESSQGEQGCSCVWLAFTKGLKDCPGSATCERGSSLEEREVLGSGGRRQSCELSAILEL